MIWFTGFGLMCAGVGISLNAKDVMTMGLGIVVMFCGLGSLLSAQS